MSPKSKVQGQSVDADIGLWTLDFGPVLRPSLENYGFD